jgi:hypothetical protein
MIREIFALVSKRTDRACNFLENKGIVPGADAQGCKFIYRHYATLYFIIVADSSESELGILDLIQVFVEALDKCFENVCELDLIFHPDRVCYILDEVVQGGMVTISTTLSGRKPSPPPLLTARLFFSQVLETRQDEILSALAAMAKIEKEQDPLSKVKSVLNSVRGK